MNTGMLWFDNNKQTTIPTKIEQAVKYYREKYEQEPDICYLNPQMLPVSGKNLSKKSKEKGEKLTVGNLEIQQTPLVLPNHFWIGVSAGDGQTTQAG